MQYPKIQRSKIYVAKAVGDRSGFHAEFANPGYPARNIQDAGKDMIFSSAERAELAAARMVIEMANDRLKMKTNSRGGPPMSPAELSERLSDLQMSPTDADAILETGKIMEWLGGERKIPNMARIILDLMQDPAIKEKLLVDAASKKQERITACTPSEIG